MLSTSRIVQAALTVLALAGCSLARSQPLDARLLLTPAATPAPAAARVPAAPPDALTGFATYQEKCAPCHGIAGDGLGPRAQIVREQGGLVASLVEPARALAAKPSDWFDVVSKGRLDRLMPGFEQSLSPQQRWDVLAYVWSLGAPAERFAAASRQYAEQCAGCHGARGDLRPDGRGAALSDPAYLASHSLAQIADALATPAHATLNLAADQRLGAAAAVRALGYAYADPAPLQASVGKGDGALGVQLQNLTLGGPPASSPSVVLRIYDQQGEVFSRTASAGSDGLAEFQRLPVRPDYFYQAETTYQGGRFFSEPAQLTGTQRLTRTLGVYEVTNDPAAISIGEMHYFVQGAAEDTLTIAEVYVFDNAGAKAYVAAPGSDGAPRSLRVTVPSDARNLRFDGPGLGARFTRDGDAIIDSDAVPPGQRAAGITMLYDIPYRDGKRVERKVAYPVRAWDVILPGADLKVASAGMTERTVQTGTGLSVRVVVPDAGSVPAGGALTFELAGQPRGAAAPGADAASVGIGFIVFALAVGASYLIFLRARAFRGAAPETVEDRRERLLRKIAELDDRHAAGALKTKTYLRQREQLLSELRAIWS